MRRYQGIKLDSNYTPQRYVTVKYPEIERDESDYYVFPTIGDRYDLLAQSYYNDKTLWWVISIANPTSEDQDSLIPPIGVQLRIPHPSRIPGIIGEYDSLNF